MAEQWNLPNTYTSVADLLSDSAIEAVVVLTNPVSHFDVCLEAVRAGYTQARALLEQAQLFNVLVSSASDTCFGSAQQLSLRVLKSGDIG